LRTVLDDVETWFLHAVVYQDELQVIVAEGILSLDTEDLRVGDKVIEGVHRVEVSDQSRLFSIRFRKIIAWQVVDEEYFTSDECDQPDDTGKLQALSRSKYLDYIRNCHHWYEDITGPGMHYRVLTANEVVEVVACTPPVIVPWEST
jgi:hypothetical protein